MIVLDTNVISEPLRERPEMKVVAWLDSHLATDLFFTATSLTELQFGLAILQKSKRRSDLESRLTALLHRLFEGRFLHVDRNAALVHARIAASAREKGVSISFADAQIAAIALAQGFAVATRDVAAFEATGVDVINPWA